LNGQANLPALNITLNDVKAIAKFQGDKLVIDSIRASSGDRPGNYLFVSGSIDSLLTAHRKYDVTLLAKDFHVIDRRTKAKLDISVPLGGIRVAGTAPNVTVGGSLVVERGQVFLPDPELARKQLLEVSLDTTVSPVDPNVATDALLSRFGLRSAQ